MSQAQPLEFITAKDEIPRSLVVMCKMCDSDVKLIDTKQVPDASNPEDTYPYCQQCYEEEECG